MMYEVNTLRRLYLAHIASPNTFIQDPKSWLSDKDGGARLYWTYDSGLWILLLSSVDFGHLLLS
jgi:hypothetical protein